MDKLTIPGVNNIGEPRQEYADKLATYTDDQFVSVAATAIWFSAYASNNPRSDYHWHADACYNEAVRRGKPELYQQAYDSVERSVG